MTTRTIAYVGNFGPPHSTENEVRKALGSLGVQVVPFQENAPIWPTLALDARDAGCEAVLWTRTWSIPGDPQLAALDALRAAGIPTIGYHLDRWWGLDREEQIHREPFFRCDLLVTADGGHADQWTAAGVNHVWMPPGVDAAECARRPTFDPQYDYDIGFVGTWQSYHHEWPRRELVVGLIDRYQRRFRPFCCGIRGKDLTDLYGTVRVMVGDSCLAGDATHYWSDRIPETLGRGGFLIHPDVPGLDEHYTPGEHLVTYPLGDIDALDAQIDWYLAHPVERTRIARAGQAHVKARHTYRHRMEAVLALLDGLGAVRGRVGPVTVHRRGVSGRFDLRDGDGVVVDEVWRDGVYPLEPAEVRDRVVVDIGANIGAFSIWAARAGARKVYAYEPDPVTADRLAGNARLNDLDATRLVPIVEGVGAQTGERWLSGDNATAHLVDAPASLTDTATRVVEVRSIDTVLLSAGDHLIVKMDCEGCEHEVIADVLPGHLRRIDRLVMEYHDGTADWRAHPEAFGRLVRKLAEDGMVTIVGRPSSGLVNIDWRRYGA